MSDLRKREPIEIVYISPKALFGACIIFAIIFWIIGLAFRYYIPIGV